jgi:phage portal protein BeeE
MPNFLDSIKSGLRDGIKAAGGTFSGGGGTSTPANNGLNWNNSGRMFGLQSGSRINWSMITGGLQENPIASTCLSIITENYVQARIRVEKRGDDQDKYEPDATHPLLPILKQPNPFYSWAYLTKGIIASMHGSGDGYIGIERDGRGLPSELYWLPYGVTPHKNKNSKRLWDSWDYKTGDKTVNVPIQDIIKIPLGADPNRPGFGLSVANILKQDQYTLQQGTNYTANVMRNNGTVGVLLTPKSIKDGNNNIVQPDIDPKTVVDTWRSKTRGDNSGDAMYLDFPLDVSFPKNSPQELAIDTILDRPESNICAVMRVSILLVGAYGGRQAKTYANFEEARLSLWEECLLPLQSIIASELTTQLIPQFGGDPTTERVAYDTSGIRALQPDADALNKRYLESWQANAITRADYKRGTKQQVLPEDEKVYFWMLPKVTDTGQVAGGQITDGLENAGHDVGILADKQDAAETERNAPPVPLVPPQNGAQGAGRALVGVASNGNGKH